MVEARAELIGRPETDQEGETDAKTSKIRAANEAYRLLHTTMNDVGQPLHLRLACAEQILNRTWGRPNLAPPPKPEQPDRIDLTRLSNDELEQLRKLAEKLSIPVEDPAAPQNIGERGTMHALA